MLAMIKQLKWHHLVVVHDNDAHSTRLAQSLMQLSAASNEICILAMTQYKYTERTNRGVNEDIKYSNQNTLQSVLPEINYKTPVLVLMHRTSIQSFLERLEDHVSPNSTGPLQLFFSNLPTHDDIKLIPKRGAKIYSISFKTDRLRSFEEYWRDRIRHIKVNDFFLFQLIDFSYLCTVLLILKYYGHPVVNATFLNHYIPLLS
jgi:hypothetical protein